MSELYIFFEEKLNEALKNQKKYIPDDMRVYTLGLLCNNMSAFSTERALLFDLYQDSLTGSKIEKEVKLKKLGDHTIITVGCFTPYAYNGINGTDYYVSMGKAAFSSANTLSNKEIYHQANIYFLDIVSIMNEIIDVCSSFDKTDLYNIYSSWQTTKSIPVGNYLAKNGISLVGGKA